MNDNQGNVVLFNGITRLDIPADRVITAAVGKLQDVIIVGYDKDGGFYFASSKASGPEVVWLLELAKKILLEIGDA